MKQQNRNRDLPKNFNRRMLGKPLDEKLRWIPAVNPFKSRKSPQQTIKLAGIVSERLYYGLKDECDLTLLVEEEWDAAQLAHVDFLLIETCVASVLNDWHFCLSPQPSEQLIKLIKVANDRQIPTVLWITWDVCYLDLFKDSLQPFNAIFAADDKVVEQLQQLGIAAHHLPPAIQPRLFNPVRSLGSGSINGIDYAVVSQLKNSPQLPSRWHKNLGKLGSFERTMIRSHKSLQLLSEKFPNILFKGEISFLLLPEVLKRLKGIFYFDDKYISPTELYWQIIENTACLCKSYLIGEFDTSIFAGLNVECAKDTEQLLLQMETHQNKIVSQAAEAHSAWRRVMLQDTFEHRLNTILQVISSKRMVNDNLKVTVVTPTMRPENINKIIHNYERQNYSNKELIIVFNGTRENYTEMTACISNRNDIIVLFLPHDYTAGVAINLATNAASGHYIFRFDDDDVYGENYITDIMLWLKVDSAEIIGKQTIFIKILDDDKVYLRNTRKYLRFNQPKSYLAADFGSQETFLSGATFVVQTELLRQYPFPVDSYNSADTRALDNFRRFAGNAKVLKLDGFNFTIGRNNDSNKHTWIVEVKHLVNTSILLDPCQEIPK